MKNDYSKISKMFVSLAISLAWIPLIASGQTLESEKPVMLFICAGQSNMVGGVNSGSFDTAMPEANLPRNDIWFWYSNTNNSESEGWVPLGSVRGGPETAFAVRMSDLFPDHTIAILKIASGGVPIKFFLPGEVVPANSRAGYFTMERLIPLAVADLQEKKDAAVIPSFAVAGFVWMQGEGDANGVIHPEWLYYENLGELNSLVNSFAGTQDLPFVLGRISAQLSPSVVRPTGQLRVSKSEGGGLPDNADFVNDGQLRGPVWYISELDNVRNSQMRYCDELSHAQWVTIDDLTLTDFWHYGPEGYVEMGKRFANAYMSLREKWLLKLMAYRFPDLPLTSIQVDPAVSFGMLLDSEDPGLVYTCAYSPGLSAESWNNISLSFDPETVTWSTDSATVTVTSAKVLNDGRWEVFLDFSSVAQEALFLKLGLDYNPQ